MKRVLLEPAYVLHRRIYRETSLLVELWTANYGRFTLVAKGVRKARNHSASLLQPFIPLLVSWSGRGELMTLTHVEGQAHVSSLSKSCLFAAFYLNELLVCLLQKWDPHPVLYAAYEKSIQGLRTDILEQKVLRSFEKCLLEELGYGLLPKSHISLHKTFASDKYYRFIPEQGLVEVEEAPQQVEESISFTHVFSGKSLLAIAQEQWENEATLRDAKRLARFAIATLLGSRPLYSRQLFKQFDEDVSI